MGYLLSRSELMSDCVIVVERDDGVWDASCFDARCGGVLHGIGASDGSLRRRLLPRQRRPPTVVNSRRWATRMWFLWCCAPHAGIAMFPGTRLSVAGRPRP